MNLPQAVCFAILMEEDDGILGKSPDYIQEKLDLCRSFHGEKDLLILLDKENQEKLLEYRRRWSYGS